ncbi:MAG: hypothetical protein JNL07_07755 [Rhodospirillales bacterium]|nr:hypothetical protein [Rhodospirillales bacterium]
MNDRNEARGFPVGAAPDANAGAARSKTIAAVLPGLRAYACALAGSPAGGDRCVRHFLETLLASPPVHAADDYTRMQCFAVFREICRGLAPTAPTAAAAGAGWIGLRLAVLPPVSREVLLLVYLADFPVGQAAWIVGISEDEARGRLRAASLAFEGSIAAPEDWRPAAIVWSGPTRPAPPPASDAPPAEVFVGSWNK